jgi:hypothetical protein
MLSGYEIVVLFWDLPLLRTGPFAYGTITLKRGFGRVGLYGGEWRNSYPFLAGAS